MRDVIRIFEEIKETRGKNDKELIITRHSENELFKKCLVFLLDNSIVTGISKKKIKKRLNPVVTFTNFEDVMIYLKKNNTGRDLDVAIIQTFIDNQPEEHREFYEGMVTKTLKLGCDSKTVNKCIPGLIEVWNVQLGSAYKDLKLTNGEYFYLSKKLNGNRCSFYNGKLISRQGKEFKGLNHIIENIKDCGLSNYFLDGELVRKNVDDISDNENFRIGTGIVNSDSETKEEISFVIFDMFLADEFKNGCSKDLYSVRKKNLLGVEELIKRLHLKHLEVVEMVYEGTNQSKIEEWSAYANSNDWEGLMLNKNAPYECKRTKNLIKVKVFNTADLTIVGVEEGDGRLKGTLGALVVNYKGNTVNVGSGFTDEERARLWKDKDSLIGSIVEVQYFVETKDKKTGLPSIQFPTFVTMREDKTQESYH